MNSAQAESLKNCPHLLSPAHLAIADTGGKWKAVPHLKVVSEALVRGWTTPNSRTAIVIPFQHGKEIAHDTPVWTEDGWKTHGTLQVGDYVFSPNGLPVKVEVLGPEVAGNYEVEFSDGSVICCHALHEWFVYVRTRHKWGIFETWQLTEGINNYGNNICVHKGLPPKTSTVTVVSVGRCVPRLGRCIQVEGGLYLVGENLITTHNSLLGSVYFPAWVLLLWPETRVALASYEEGFACNFGGRVREVVSRYGPAFGINLRGDTSAKGEWVIESHGGGMVCKGRGGALTGRPADLLILDDMIKSALEAQSPAILDGLWEWYCTVAYSRLGPRAPIIGIGTRWGPRDLFGRWEAEAKVGGDKFTTIIFSAIAGPNDPLGRRVGEALWPERVPLARLERIAKTRPRWFKACWQGKPEETSGLHYQPSEWPRYVDVGDAWRVSLGFRTHNYRKVDCQIIIAVDWAQRGKKDSNKTAFVVGALTVDGLMLILDVFNERLRYEENRPALRDWCIKWDPVKVGSDPLIVATDDDMLSEAMVVECRRSREIPEIRRLGIHSRSKLVRAQAGIIRSQNGLFLVPDPPRAWYEEVADQLAGFTGAEGAEDDVADCFGILGRLADEFKPGDVGDEYEPLLGAAGYDSEGVW